MSTVPLNNGSRHEIYKVDEVVLKLDRLIQQGNGFLLLIDLHRLSVPNHPKIGKIKASQIADLRNVELLQSDNTPSQLVKDVVLSTTKGDDLTLVYTGSPYVNPQLPSERMGIKNSDLANVLDTLALLRKLKP